MDYRTILTQPWSWELYEGQRSHDRLVDVLLAFSQPHPSFFRQIHHPLIAGPDREGMQEGFVHGCLREPLLLLPVFFWAHIVLSVNLVVDL